MNLKATNKTETNKYELEVEISAEDFNKALSEVAKTEGKKMSVPGFRKGHAPRSVIEKMYGENVFFEAAVDKLYRPAMQDAIEASGLEVIAVSNADVTSVSRENGIELKLTVVVKPVITIEGYKGIEATKKNVEVTDEDVSAELVKVQDRNSRMVDVDNRGALTGDTAVIDFEGFCDGKAFEGGKAEGFELSLGSGQFIPGFEDQVVGHEVGDEFEISVKFPEDYQAEELKGKDATFKIKLHQIRQRILHAGINLFRFPGDRGRARCCQHEEKHQRAACPFTDTLFHLLPRYTFFRVTRTAAGRGSGVRFHTCPFSRFS